MSRAWLILAAAIVLAAGLAGAQGAGEGLGVSPPQVDLADAQPGQTYHRTVQVQNPTDTPSGIGILRSGEVAQWTATDPPGNFTIPAHGVRDVALSIAVPGGAGPGRHSGQLTFIADPKEPPSGSGSTVRPSVGLLLNFTVGGDAVERLAWISARVEDAPVGASVHAFVLARNDGNVRTTAEATGQVLAFVSDDVLREAEGSLDLEPGEQQEVAVTFPAGLAAGQYRARLRSPPADGFDETHDFKVFPQGSLVPDGVLRAITHVPYGTAGRPVRLDAWFHNTGNVTISSAVFHGEVRQDGELLATVDSGSLVVAAGAHANLTAYWTPPSAGTYLVTGHVTYDGYRTLESQSPLNVRASAVAITSWWWILLVLIAVTLLAWLWAWRKGRRDRQAEERSRGRR